MKTLTAALLLAATVAATAQTPVASYQAIQPAPIQNPTATSQASLTQLINDMAIRQQAAQNAAAINSLQLIQRPVVITTVQPAAKSSK